MYLMEVDIISARGHIKAKYPLHHHNCKIIFKKVLFLPKYHKHIRLVEDQVLHYIPINRPSIYAFSANVEIYWNTQLFSYQNSSYHVCDLTSLPRHNSKSQRLDGCINCNTK